MTDKLLLLPPAESLPSRITISSNDKTERLTSSVTGKVHTSGDSSQGRMATRGVGKRVIIKSGLNGKIPNFMDCVSGTSRRLQLHEVMSLRKCQNTTLNRVTPLGRILNSRHVSALIHQQHQATENTVPVSIQPCSPPGTLELQPDLLTCG